LIGFNTHFWLRKEYGSQKEYIFYTLSFLFEWNMHFPYLAFFLTKKSFITQTSFSVPYPI
jgi:hypothetical protein